MNRKSNPLITDVQKYWDTRPCNVRHSPKQVGTKEYFDEVERRKYFVEPHIPKFANFDHWSDKKVLEIGCGIGTDAVNFARAGADYHAIELSSKSLQITEERFKIFNLNGNFHHVTDEQFSNVFGSTKFDLIYSFGVIHHTPNPRKIIEQARLLSHELTHFNFMVYAKNSFKSAMIEGGLDQPEAQFGCPIANTYDEQDIENLLEGQFTVSSIEQNHIFPYNVEKYKKYEYELEPWFSSMSDEMFHILEKKFGWHMLINAKPTQV